MVEKKTKKIIKEGRLSKIYNRWLVRNVPFYLFAAVLAIFYIANGHYADKMMRGIREDSRLVKELEYKYKSVKQNVIFRSKESELAKATGPLGLHPLIHPPVLIRDTIWPE